MDNKNMENSPMENAGDAVYKDGSVQPWPDSLSPKKQLRLLKAEANKALETYHELFNRVEKFNQEWQVPELRARYEGKYWKSCENDDDPFLYYVYCRELTDSYRGIFDRFNMGTDGTSSVDFATKGNFHMCAFEITREEYMEKLALLVARMGSLGVPNQPEQE